VTLAAYNGHEALTFTDYLDLGSGKTLHAEPGGTYDIAPASGRGVPEFPEPWFTAVQGEAAAAEGDAAAPDPGGEGAGEELAHDEDPGGTGQEDEHSAF
jgi:hypothetical protein